MRHIPLSAPLFPLLSLFSSKNKGVNHPKSLLSLQPPPFPPIFSFLLFFLHHFLLLATTTTYFHFCFHSSTVSISCTTTSPPSTSLLSFFSSDRHPSPLWTTTGKPLLLHYFLFSFLLTFWSNPLHPLYFSHHRRTPIGPPSNHCRIIIVAVVFRRDSIHFPLFLSLLISLIFFKDSIMLF